MRIRTGGRGIREASPMNETKRFLDDRRSLDDFMDETLVECPRCQGCATVYRRPKTTQSHPRLVCPGCGYSHDAWTKHFDTGDRERGDRRDEIGSSAFPCGSGPAAAGRELWAFNRQHLLWIEQYVAADLRDTPKIQSMVGQIRARRTVCQSGLNPRRTATTCCARSRISRPSDADDDSPGRRLKTIGANDERHHHRAGSASTGRRDHLAV